MNAVLECDGKRGTMFNVINKLLHLSGSSPLPWYDSSVELANDFTLFFNYKIVKIPICLSNSAVPQIPLYKSEFSEFHITAVEEVLKIMTNAPIISCQLNLIPADIFKQSVKTLAPTITDIVNKSLQSMPESLKEAIVLPPLTKPQLDNDNFNNYRPVLNLPYISKVIEWVAASQLAAHLTANSRNETNQLAYC